MLTDSIFMCHVLSIFPVAQLILVFGVIFVIIFVYSVISFAFLHNFFNNQDGQFCDSLGQCYVSVLRGGLLDTLGSVCCSQFYVCLFLMIFTGHHLTNHQRHDSATLYCGGTKNGFRHFLLHNCDHSWVKHCDCNSG